MRTTRALTIAFLAASFYSTAVGSDKGITISGKFSCPFVYHRGGTVYLQISIASPTLEAPRRQPLNLAVVLDRSGSMADEGKIEYAKRAVRTLIDQLEEGDIFSFVIYDDVVDVLREARSVSDKNELRRLLERVYPRGSTNLGGGMVEGLHQVERHCDKEYLNRVILLSDGLANRGITDAYELRKIAQRYRSRSISLTTMGVGLDYNEDLMLGLSRSGGGNYYFIESPNSLASIFKRELRSLACVAVQNASIELTLANEVRLRDAIGCDHHADGGRVVIPVGDLSSGEVRDLTLELEVPEGVGTFHVVKGVLKYDGKRGWFESWPSFDASIQYTNDLSEVERKRDNATQAKVDVAVSTRSVDRALEALDQGRKDEAADLIQAAQVVVRSSPAMMSGAGAGILGEQKSRLENFQKLLMDTVDTRKAKKSIQYQNYQTQKQEK